jgi:cation-transporting ATPase 13A1
MKKDSKAVIKELKRSNHMVKMITGDNQLTAAYVAKQLQFGIHEKSNNSTVFLEVENKNLVWKDDDDKIISKSLELSEIKKLSKSNLLCMNGDSIEGVKGKIPNEQIQQLFFHTVVFARTSPEQKDFIVGALNTMGKITLMCGDGTNDVGSLKRSHVGIAVVN